jgi:putative oxidoreductase
MSDAVMHYAGWAVFAWVFVNQAGAPVSVVPSLVGAGALAASGGPRIVVTVAAAVAAALCADIVWYGAGRWCGPKALRLLRRGSVGLVERAERLFIEHEMGFQFLARFLPALNAIVAGVAVWYLRGRRGSQPLVNKTPTLDHTRRNGMNTMTVTAQVTRSTRPSKALHISLWVVQALLGLVFLTHSAMLVTQPIAALAEMMVWPGAVPAALVRFIGICEMLGALGLIFPTAMRIKPTLTPLAAAGLTTILGFAAAFHLSRGEFAALPIALVLSKLTAFVAWGRLAKAPIPPR